MKLIGDYLNGYSGKLSLENGNRRIKLDKEEFDTCY